MYLDFALPTQGALKGFIQGHDILRFVCKKGETHVCEGWMVSSVL